MVVSVSVAELWNHQYRWWSDFGRGFLVRGTDSPREAMRAVPFTIGDHKQGRIVHSIDAKPERDGMFVVTAIMSCSFESLSAWCGRPVVVPRME